MTSGILVLSLLAFLLLQGDSCRSAPKEGPTRATSDTPAFVPAGSWGGDHIGLEVSESGAEVEYDCAHGTIDEAMILDESGRFEVDGTHVREHGGPEKEEKPEPEKAHYSGLVEGERMTLTVVMSETKESLGTFTLVFGRSPRITKCL